ncbi:phosphoribosyl-AMP cyclohydrolase [Rhodobium gokarnense]|uniref:phosphoribosyl-AMP cyclohydrolase n=1 Tax=Rhodobium gokarnense TaxID=364296 RepID=A0ABT3HDI9_9HYPH|nr:phosphoribosyl-AMP cyclohydrolase [Rhodobium gokarnense]MCW2308455.1 phosphoribosyl-AMP cyclohydrolase [Rhodobium gokarnense]
MTETSSPFAERASKDAVEKGTTFAPKFDADGLIPCITVDADSGAVLMFAHMSRETLAETIEIGEAVYWSRSRAERWHKGATSGSVQKLVEMRTDCDQDVILVRVHVEGSGASCHLGYRSCFFRAVPVGTAPTPATELTVVEDGPLFDPDVVYGNKDKS